MSHIYLAFRFYAEGERAAHKQLGLLLTKTTPSYWYRLPQCKPETVWRPSQVYHGNPHTNKTVPSQRIDTASVVVEEIKHNQHDDVIKLKHFPRNWPFVRGIHWSRWIPYTKAVTRSFDVFFDLCLNKRLSKQPWGWWFETPSWSLWRQCNEVACYRWTRDTCNQ